MEKPKIGTVGWHDLTVPDAERIKDFYERVVGLDSAPVDMGGYSDFSMLPPGGGDAVAGVCHARGENANLPPQWILYFIVESVERSAQACVDGGGELISPIRKAGAASYCVIKDPAGAVCAIYQP
jgi:predicted enzyme related to lactoylglutathione lyase